MPSAYAWRHSYEQAMVETNGILIPGRITAAEAAINARMEEISFRWNGSLEEENDIVYALHRLRLLREELPELQN
jgi:hypothetical protein